MTFFTAVQTTLTRRLLFWVLSAQLAVTACLVGLSYHNGLHESEELNDWLLEGTATIVLNLKQPDFINSEKQPVWGKYNEPEKHEYEPSLSVAVWDAQGQSISRSGPAPASSFSDIPGFRDVALGSPPIRWRSFAEWNTARTRLAVVMINAEDREDMAQDIGMQMVLPSLALLPIVALILGFAIRRGVQPLKDLSREVAQLDGRPDARLAVRYPYREFNPVVLAINRLLGLQQEAIERERQLASEIAHELRTPLASISLQATALKTALPATEQAQAVRQIGADAMRAGHVVNQLLALARASRADLQRQMGPLDLADWVRPIVADYAQTAWKYGHQLSVEGPDGVVASAHPLMLELAMRNLISNALQHNPKGTTVSVGWGRRDNQVWLEVCDDGTPDADAAIGLSPADRLGLGHKIVRRVMLVHGGSFDALPEQSYGQDERPWLHCYRLVLTRANASVTPTDETARLAAAQL